MSYSRYIHRWKPFIESHITGPVFDCDTRDTGLWVCGDVWSQEIFTQHLLVYTASVGGNIGIEIIDKKN